MLPCSYKKKCIGGKEGGGLGVKDLNNYLNEYFLLSLINYS